NDGRPFSERQLTILDDAASRRFLFDLEPRAEECVGWEGYWREADPGRFWDLDRFAYPCPFMTSQSDWELALRTAGRQLRRGHRQRQHAYVDTREPGHFRVWRDYCAYVLQRPPVLVGRFGPFHFGSLPFVGLLVDAGLGECCFHLHPQTWSRLLTTVA